MPATIHNACLRDNIVHPNIMGFKRKSIEYLAIVPDTYLHPCRTVQQPVVISASATQTMTSKVKT